MLVPRTIEGLRLAYPNASTETLQLYIDLREEGYSAHAAKLMAGLTDPEEDHDYESSL